MVPSIMISPHCFAGERQESVGVGWELTGNREVVPSTHIFLTYFFRCTLGCARCLGVRYGQPSVIRRCIVSFRNIKKSPLLHWYDLGVKLDADPTSLWSLTPLCTACYV